MKTWQKIIFLFGFSLLTHLPGIKNPILDFHGWAQTLRASIARNYYEGGMNFFKPMVDFHGFNPQHADTQFPLYSYLIAVCYKVFGENELWGRILSIIFAALGTVVLFFLARELLEERAATLAGIFFSLIPIRIYFMRTVMPEAMAIFFLLLGYYYCLRWIKSDRFFPEGFICAFSLTLCCLLKLPYLFLLFPLLFFVQKNLKKVFFVILFLFLGLSSWYFYSRTGTLALSVKESPFLYETNIPWEWFTAEFWTLQFLSRYPEILTTYSGFLFLTVGVWISWKKKVNFLLVWYFGTLLYLIICGKYGRIHQYTALPFAPIHALLMAVGFFYFWDRSTIPWRRTLLIFLVIAMPVHAYFRIKHWYRLEETWIFSAKEVVNKISTPKDLFFIDTEDHPFFLYHFHRKGFTKSLYPYGSNEFEEAYAQGIQYFFIHGSADSRESDAGFTARFQLLHRDKDFVIYKAISHKNDA